MSKDPGVDGRQLDDGLPPGFPRVVALDGATRVDLFERWLPNSVTVVRPSSFGEARSAIDEGTAVVFVRHEFSEEIRERIAALLDSGAPHSRTVLTTTDHSPVTDEYVDEDACLYEPVDRETFRDTVSRELHVAMYRILLERYYECSAAVTTLEVRRDDDELDDDEQYSRLNVRLKHLKVQIDRVQSYLDPDDIEGLLFDIVPPEFERQANERPANESKYRPDHCHKCGRDWNVNPDGSRAGYKRLGSFVWQCDECSTVYDRSDPTNNQIDPPR